MLDSCYKYWRWYHRNKKRLWQGSQFDGRIWPCWWQLLVTQLFVIIFKWCLSKSSYNFEPFRISLQCSLSISTFWKTLLVSTNCCVVLNGSEWRSQWLVQQTLLISHKITEPKRMRILVVSYLNRPTPSLHP